MAKEKSSAPITSAAPLVTPDYAKDYVDRTEDMVGYWNEDSGEPIHCTPRYAVLFDNKVDPRNPSILIFCDLLHETSLLKKEDDQKTEFKGKPGERIGIFAKPGMRRIGKLADANALIFRDPTKDKDVGKPEKMKYFKVMNAPNAVEKQLQVMDDRRKESFMRTTFLDPPNKGRGSSPGKASDNNGDIF